MLMSEADLLVKEIIEEKLRLEKEGKKPRLVLLGKKAHDMLESSWIESVKCLPWGDTLEYELQAKVANRSEVFLGDGSLCDLWVVRVDTIEGFEVR